MWNGLWWLIGGSPQPQPTGGLEPRPPEVVVDEAGAEVRFNRVPQGWIEWSQVRQVAVDVIDYGGGHAEGFWDLAGAPVPFGVPVEIVAGSEAFNARLFGLPGFDMTAYQRAREAEAAGGAGYFVCWRAQDSEEPDGSTDLSNNDNS
jgi:hypothetical protein